MNIDKTLRRAYASQANIDAKQLPLSRIKREESLNERDAEYHPQGYGIYFCLHDKSYYEVCPRCKRTRRDAERNLLNL